MSLTTVRNLTIILFCAILVAGCGGNNHLTKPAWQLITNTAFESAALAAILSGECIPSELKDDIIPVMERTQKALIDGDGTITVGELVLYLSEISDVYITKDADPVLESILKLGVRDAILLLQLLGSDEDMLSGDDYESAKDILEITLGGLKAAAAVAEYYEAWC